MQTRAPVVLFLLATAASCASPPRRNQTPSTTATTMSDRGMFSEAEAYERFMGRWSRLLAPSLITFSGIEDGGAVLDVGSGTGALAMAIRDATKTTRIIGLDPSRAYTEQAAAKNADPRVSFTVGDAQALGFSDGAFDVTTSMLVMNFIPDRRRARDEMIRVTKPGGVVSAAVWDYAEGMEMLRVFWDEAIALDPASEPRDEKNMPLCKRGELAAFFREGALRGVEESELVITIRFASFDDYWQPFLLGQGPAGAYVARLSEAKRNALAARLRARLGDRAFELRARAWAAKGRRAS
jgi:SAM-dependent methyltransferase